MFIVAIQTFETKPLEVERQILVLLLLFDSTLLNQSPFLKQLVIYCPKYESTCKTNKLSIQFDAKGSFRKMKDSEYDLDVLTTGIVVTPNIDINIMKINIGYLNFDNTQN